ncbi:MAG TPA: LacI family DNA-binding transcriptional regulator [Bacillota bacterium]
MPSTLYDVAKLAGVSPKTVSRVLNESHLVSGTTRKRVDDAIRELDYHPNAIATSLKKQRSNIIGFMVPYGSDFVFQDPNMMEQLRGVHDLLTQEGYEVIVSAPVYKKEAFTETLRLVKHRNVDGVILYPSAGIEQIIHEFKVKNFHYVTLGTCYSEQKHNFVELDVTPGAYMAAKHLISLGHREIGLINKPSSFFIYGKDDLLTGYRTALEEQKLPFQSRLVREGDYTFSGGYQAFQILYDFNPKLTAVICASDPMTYGVIKAIQDMGLQVGKDIAVVAGDNLPLTQKLFPDISCINNPAYQQGSLAGKILTTVIREGHDIPGVTLKTDFTVRGQVPRF